MRFKAFAVPYALNPHSIRTAYSGCSIFTPKPSIFQPTVLIWSLRLTAGYILAIPFAMLTAAPALGALFVRTGLCGIPEDFEPPAEIVAIQGGAAR